MREHRLLQRLQLRPRIDAKLLEQRRARLLIGTERVRLTTTAVEREHDLSMEAFPQGMQTHQRRSEGDRLAWLVVGQQCVNELLLRRDHELVEPDRCIPSEGEVPHVGERRSPHEVEGGAMVCDRLARRAGVAGFSAGPQQPLEPEGVDVLRAQHEHVPRAAPFDGTPAERPSQRRDLGLQGVDRVGDGVVVPHLVDEALVRHGVRCAEGEQGEDRLELHAGDGDRSVAAEHLDPAEQPHIDASRHAGSVSGRREREPEEQRRI